MIAMYLVETQMRRISDFAVFGCTVAFPLQLNMYAPSGGARGQSVSSSNRVMTFAVLSCRRGEASSHVRIA